MKKMGSYKAVKVCRKLRLVIQAQSMLANLPLSITCSPPSRVKVCVHLHLPSERAAVGA